jgi:DNA-binding transcriptional regulator YiaG
MTPADPSPPADQAQMTPGELRAARHDMSLSADRFAKLVQVESGRTVRRWEAAERDIPGPVQVLVRAIMSSRSVRHYFGIALCSESDARRNRLAD